MMKNIKKWWQMMTNDDKWWEIKNFEIYWRRMKEIQTQSSMFKHAKISWIIVNYCQLFENILKYDKI
jgi:hypothetical protein